jgi:hypothetical protein
MTAELATHVRRRHADRAADALHRALVAWRALVERIRQGDRSQMVARDEVAAELGL